MTIKNVLVTGGAGFVGTHLCQELVKRGYLVTVLDNLDTQVHGRLRRRPPHLPNKVRFVKGDVTDFKTVNRLLKNTHGLFHLAAAVGVGQSMYEIRHYVKANSMGGAVVLEALLNHRKTIKKVVVASSMSIYGEGAYKSTSGKVFYPFIRSESQLKKGQWDFNGPGTKRVAKSIPTPENKPLNPTSIYAVTKRDHEENFLAVGNAYRIPTTALRFFNIYGPYQALSNPYTGVAAIFSGRLLNNKPPLIFEDGHQSRDFIHVTDIVQGCMLALENSRANYEVFNVGTGKSTSVLKMAEILAQYLGSSIKPKILKKFRAGDIRHCYGDISKIRSKLGYRPKVDLSTGVRDLIDWVAKQSGSDRVGRALSELKKRGLVS